MGASISSNDTGYPEDLRALAELEAKARAATDEQIRAAGATAAAGLERIAASDGTAALQAKCRAIADLALEAIEKGGAERAAFALGRIYESCAAELADDEEPTPDDE